MIELIPALIAFIFLGYLIYQIFQSISLFTGGKLVYVLDDPYIHMAMAKHFAEKGIWGVTPYEFSSSSSSILYTLLLAVCFKFFGVNDFIPLYINIFTAIILILVMNAVLRKQHVGLLIRTLFLLLIVYNTPFPTVIFTGMEHLLHTLINFCCVYLFAQYMADIEKINSDLELHFNYKEEVKNLFSHHQALLWALLFIAMVRFEGLFLIVIVVGLTLIRRKLVSAAIFGTVGLLPVGIYGLISTRMGWFFLPNSIVMKGRTFNFLDYFSSLENFENLLDYGVHNLMGQSHVYPLIILAAAGLLAVTIQKSRIWTPTAIIAFVFIWLTVCQAFFAGFSSMARYDAFLIFLGLATLSLSFGDLFGESFHQKHAINTDMDELKVIFQFIFSPFSAIIHFFAKKPSADGNNTRSEKKQSQRVLLNNLARAIFVFLIALFTLLPLTLRNQGYYSITPLASNNIYEQQYQMAHFLQQYYQGEKIAANDIGAINYYADLQCFDLCGLGSIEPAQNAIEGGNFRSRLYEMVEEEGVQIAVVYHTWFNGPWQKVATWEIKNNVVAGYHIVTFYAVNNSRANELKTNLIEFSGQLPSGVIVTYFI
jgi:hypothetical protein